MIDHHQILVSKEIKKIFFNAKTTLEFLCFVFFLKLKQKTEIVQFFF